MIDREIPNSNYSSVLLDNYKAGMMMADHLLSKGHRSIACITGPNGISIKDEFIFEGDFNYTS